MHEILNNIGLNENFRYFELYEKRLCCWGVTLSTVSRFSRIVIIWRNRKFDKLRSRILKNSFWNDMIKIFFLTQISKLTFALHSQIDCNQISSSLLQFHINSQLCKWLTPLYWSSLYETTANKLIKFQIVVIKFKSHFLAGKVFELSLYLHKQSLFKWNKHIAFKIFFMCKPSYLPNMVFFGILHPHIMGKSHNAKCFLFYT